MTTTKIEDDYLTMKEAAEALGYKNPRTLSNRIFRKLPVPPYIKVPGSRGIRFLREDIEAFLHSCRVTPPSGSTSTN